MLSQKAGKFLFLALFLFLPWPSLASGTAVSSSITNPIWTTENSPYVVTGTIEVTKGAVLKIEAGTEVRFNPGAKILINGELQVLGTAENPVTMTLAPTASSTGAWNGLEFTPDSVDATVKDGQYVSGSIITHTIIKYGQGIKCDDASPYISDNQITNNNIGLQIVGNKGSLGGATMDSSASNPNIGVVVPMYVKNNIFTENTTGIVINRNNGQKYIVTPANYSYVGQAVATAVIEANAFNSNTVGINIVNGDNNVILDNTLKYNSAAGILAAAASRANVIEKNNISNNEIGLDSASSDLIMMQNTVKNNFNYGLRLAARPNVFRLNNIYNNKNYNLKNTVYGLEAANNYWGTTNEAQIDATFLKTAAASSTDTLIYQVVFKPFLTAENSLAITVAPILSDYSTTTIASSMELSGVKPVGSVVFIDGRVVASDRNASNWSYRINLGLGDNSFSIYYQDISSQQSDRLSVYIRRNNELAAPTITSSLSTTTAASLVMSGIKPAGASVLINGQEAVAANDLETWSYTVALFLGTNSFELAAKDADGQYSVSVNANVVRVKFTAADVIDQEKKLSGNTLDPKLALKLAGRLLLQVETKGYIWYVSPKDNKRYYISQDNALSTFRTLALGITEANLNLIPTKESGQKGNAALRNRLKGFLLLRVEKGGQISYIDIDGYRHDILQSNLMNIFRTLSLGISDVNLRKIDIGLAAAE
ncbi:MAG: right-handed parallel beta-helix repeat-containing protein [Patescibacteria group bacterium]|jgi:parallel beta-helix repeat protein